MRFKAEIMRVGESVIGMEVINPNRKRVNRIFCFSKNKIFFTQEQKEGNLFLEPSSSIHSTSTFKNGMKYIFDKVYDDGDKKIF